MHKKPVFLAVFLILTGAFFVRLSYAVPAVKRLGVSNAGGNIQTNTVATPKASTVATQRASSVRLVGSSAKVAPKTVGGTSVLNTKTTNTADTQRLSAIGKNLIKTKVVSPGSSVQPQGGDNSALAKRISDLENQIDAKQENLEAGDGIVIDGNIISVSEEIAGLPEKVNTLNEKVDVANLSSNYYTIGQTQEYLEENYYTKAYVDQIVSQISGANVVNQFDPAFLHQD